MQCIQSETHCPFSSAQLVLPVFTTAIYGALIYHLPTHSSQIPGIMLNSFCAIINPFQGFCLIFQNQLLSLSLILPPGIFFQSPLVLL